MGNRSYMLILTATYNSWSIYTLSRDLENKIQNLPNIEVLKPLFLYYGPLMVKLPYEYAPLFLIDAITERKQTVKRAVQNILLGETTLLAWTMAARRRDRHIYVSNILDNP